MDLDLQKEISDTLTAKGNSRMVECYNFMKPPLNQYILFIQENKDAIKLDLKMRYSKNELKKKNLSLEYRRRWNNLYDKDKQIYIDKRRKLMKMLHEKLNVQSSIQCPCIQCIKSYKEINPITSFLVMERNNFENKTRWMFGGWYHPWHDLLSSESNTNNYKYRIKNFITYEWFRLSDKERRHYVKLKPIKNELEKLAAPRKRVFNIASPIMISNSVSELDFF